mmetsp:Transcript_21246/g.29784  ORF Transcript_21246/g.29784 Transcript_21246/m.29784 type:complete len:480 (-) Transcript_21246:151-1590(-)|eukprot:CAMPEP_0184860932 /NCGR_PEP_ID=MMETSP0580-20130426/5719_1 /TAXON_ID=1118495 /ORGANISM="Dactyliosolen fragilissimus" /LENGTH=479 /DNA_ID=CAMNT_0027358211 /DNA_START=291 /DNA_END=1730 /DNA_ORIENTATION=-
MIDYESFADIIGIILIIGMALYLLRKITRQSSKHALPPVAPFGYIETLKSLTGPDMPDFLRRCEERVGPIFQLRIPKSQPLIAIGDFQVCRQILNDKDSFKLKVGETTLLHKGGDDIFNVDGDFWKHSRKGFAPAFSQNHVRRMTIVTESMVEKWIKDVLEPCLSSNESFDVGEEMLNITFSILCEAAFEYNISKDEIEIFAKESIVGLKEFSKPPIPLKKFVGPFIPQVQRAHLAAERLLGICMKIIDSYEKLENPTAGTLIYNIMNNKHYKNDKERANDVMACMIAGSETTAYSLSFILLCLSRNQSDQEKLHLELIKLPFEDRSNSRFLDCVIKEGMRLHPVVAAGTFRVVSKDIVVKNKMRKGSSVLIPKGSRCMLVNNLMFRSADCFEEPHTFKPQRWENPSKLALDAFLPFGLGRRNCVGQALAKVEVKKVIVMLLSKYKFTVFDEGVTEFFITMKPVGVHLLATKREKITQE